MQERGKKRYNVGVNPGGISADKPLGLEERSATANHSTGNSEAKCDRTTSLQPFTAQDKI